MVPASVRGHPLYMMKWQSLSWFEAKWTPKGTYMGSLTFMCWAHKWPLFYRRQVDRTFPGEHTSQAWGLGWTGVPRSVTSQLRQPGGIHERGSILNRHTGNKKNLPVIQLQLLLNKPDWLASLNSILPKVCNGKFSSKLALNMVFQVTCEMITRTPFCSFNQKLSWI